MSVFGLWFSFCPSVKMTPRLTRVCARCLSHSWSGLRITTLSWRKWYGTSPQSPDGHDDDGSEAPVLSSAICSTLSRGTSRFGRRPLSPLERVSQMLPQESLSEEVWELRGNKPREENDATETDSPEKLTEDLDVPEHRDVDRVVNQNEDTRARASERVMCFGEVLLAEYRRKRRLELQKMFQLEKGAKLGSNRGFVAHDAIQGCHSGTVLRTSLGVPMLIRRPSLEEFTLFMKRGPAIAYPKVSFYTWTHCLLVALLSGFHGFLDLVGCEQHSGHHTKSHNRVDSMSWIFSQWLTLIRLSAGCHCHADDDGRERGRLGAGVGVWIRSHESLPVQSRFFLLRFYLNTILIRNHVYNILYFCWVLK